MTRDKSRKPGFYWVRYEGEVIVAEYTRGHGCSDETSHWHLPGVDACHKDQEVCELLAGPLALPSGDLVGGVKRPGLMP